MKFRPFFCFVVVLALAAAGAGSVFGQNFPEEAPPAAAVADLRGSAWRVLPGGIKKALTPGDSIHAPATLSTAPGAGLLLVFQDRTRLEIGPDGELTLKAFEFKPDQKKRELSLTLNWGRIRARVPELPGFKTGLVRLTAPGANLTAKSGDFSLKVLDQDRVRIFCFQGGLAVSHRYRFDSVFLPPNMWLTVNVDRPLPEPRPLDQAMIHQAQQGRKFHPPLETTTTTTTTTAPPKWLLPEMFFYLQDLAE